LRIAAMRVVAALEMQSKPVLQAIAASLDSTEEAVQVQALRALAQLGPAEALPLVAPKLLESGAVRQQASQVLALAGAAAVPALKKLWAGADYHGRRAIASTLGSIGGLPSFQLLVRSMPPEDLEMIKHLTGCSRQVLDALPPAGRVAAARELRTFLRDRNTLKNPHATIAGLILLGGMSEPKAVEEAQTLLLQYLDRKQPEAVRRNAAVSLARLPIGAKRGALLLPKLLPLLEEAEWSPAVQNILPLVQKLELDPVGTAKLLPLLRRSPHVAVQAHVLERLRGQDKPALAKEVVAFLASPHPRLRETAEAALKSMPSASDPLLETWLQGGDADLGRRIDAILRAQPEAVRKRCAARAVERLLALHEKGDARWQTYLEFVRATDPAVLQKRAALRLKTLRQSGAVKSREAAASLYRMLWDLNLMNAEQRYDYALLLLGTSKRDVGKEARAADPTLRVLGALAKADGAKLLKALVGERALGAEEYYYLGFHWSESGEEVRPLGRALLQHVVERYPRHKLRRAAQHKLDLISTTGASTVTT
jgi:hypothetical protein